MVFTLICSIVPCILPLLLCWLPIDCHHHQDELYQITPIFHFPSISSNFVPKLHKEWQESRQLCIILLDSYNCLLLPLWSLLRSACSFRIISYPTRSKHDSVFVSFVTSSIACFSSLEWSDWRCLFFSRTDLYFSMSLPFLPSQWYNADRDISSNSPYLTFSTPEWRTRQNTEQQLGQPFSSSTLRSKHW